MTVPTAIQNEQFWSAFPPKADTDQSTLDGSGWQRATMGVLLIPYGRYCKFDAAGAATNQTRIQECQQSVGAKA